MIDPKAEAARKKAEELQKEKEAVVKEYEERMRKKQGWWKSLTGSGGATEKKKEEKKEDDGADEREKDAKVCVSALIATRSCLVEWSRSTSNDWPALTILILISLEQLKAIDAKAAASDTAVEIPEPREYTLNR